MNLMQFLEKVERRENVCFDENIRSNGGFILKMLVVVFESVIESC
jgi:hypothetical protein